MNGEPFANDSDIVSVLAEHAVDAIFILDRRGRTTFANRAAAELLGWSNEDFISSDLHDLVHHKHPDGTCYPASECPLVSAYTSGETLRRHEDVFYHRDGSLVPVTCSNGAFHLHGEVAGSILIVRDETERKKAEQQNQLLLHELQHRIKNNLAVVQSIARQSFKSPDSANELSAFERRVAALAAAHDLLASSKCQAADLGEVVARATFPFNGGAHRICLSGPEVPLQPRAALALTLGLHELSTNAVKYGAFSNGSGSVEISWQVSGGRLILNWRERGGPPVQKPDRRGFGLRMLELGVGSELGAQVSTDFCPEGLRVTIVTPMDGETA